MKELWVQLKDIVARYGMPSTIQGVTYKAKTENWQRRRVMGVKGRVYEYEVSDIINKFELLQNYKANSDNTLREPSPDYNTGDLRVRGISVDESFFNNNNIIGELKVDIKDNNTVNISTEGAAWIILSNEFIRRQGLSNAKLATFTAIDDSMADTIRSGDVLLVSIHSDNEQTRVLDGIYVILFNGAVMVKRLQYNPVTASYNIISDNTQYQTFTIIPKDEPAFKVIAKLERVLSKK